MRIVLLIIIVLFTSFGFCQQTKKITVESLKIKLAEFLLKKNQIKTIEEHIIFRGIHKSRVDADLKNGIYVFNNGGSHSLSFFVIVDNNSFYILDISNLLGLKKSIAKTLEFANKQNYCTEITVDYVSKLIGVYYRINRNPRNKGDVNCEFGRKPIKSTFDLNSLKLKLAEYLVKKKEIKDIDLYFEDPESLIIWKMDVYHGVDKKEKVKCGVYSFCYIVDDIPNPHYLIVNEDWVETFGVESSVNLINGINKILDFAEIHNYCHLKIEQIIEQIIEIKYSGSCFDNPIFELP